MDPPTTLQEQADATKIAEIQENFRDAVGDTAAIQIWTFSSSGWLFIYFFGVVKALRDLDRQERINVIGSSGGSCAGSFTFLNGADIDEVVEYIKGCAQRARSGSLKDLFAIRSYVQGAIRTFMSDGAAKAVSGKMEISVSKLQNPLTHWPPWPLKNVRITEFANESDLEDAVMASSCILPFPPQYVRGVGWCIDGVFSDMALISGIIFGRPYFLFHRLEHAITVCPFYGSRADLKPSAYVPPWWAAIPPPAKDLDWLYSLGYKDCMAFLLVKEHSTFGIPAWARATVDKESVGAEDVQNGDAGGLSVSADDVTKRVQAACVAVSSRVALALTKVQQASTSITASVAEAAQSAVGCEVAAEEVVTGTVTKFRKLVSLIAWSMIISEMVLQSCLAGAVATWSPVLGNFKSSWVRFARVTKTLGSPKLFMKALPALGPHIDLEAARNRRFAEALREHSILYRWLFYLLY